MSSRSRPANETKLDDWTAPSAEADPEPSADDESRQLPGSAPDGSVDSLAEIFHDIVGEYTVTESQQETPSHDPIEGSDHQVPDLSDDGLEDAADSDLIIGGWK